MALITKNNYINVDDELNYAKSSKIEYIRFSNDNEYIIKNEQYYSFDMFTSSYIPPKICNI